MNLKGTHNTLIYVCAAAFFASILGFVFGTLWNKGCTDLLAAGAVAGCAEFIIFRYQTLIGIGGAIAGAIIAARPVWQQLKEMARQSDAQTLDYLRQRSVELDNEDALTYALTTSIAGTSDALGEVAANRMIIPSGQKLIAAQFLGALHGAQQFMNETVEKFDKEAGPLWGTTEMHSARATIRDKAHRYAFTLFGFASKLQPNGTLTDEDLDKIAKELLGFQKAVFNSAGSLHNGISAERDRVAKRISALEAKI